MLRRTFLGGSVAAAGVALVGLPAFAAIPKPAIFMHQCLNLYLHDGRPWADTLRAEFLRRVSIVPSHRTDATTRYKLKTRYTFDIAYDGPYPDGLEEFIAASVVNDFAIELAPLMPVSLVAFDTYGPMIDPWTFMPFLDFYMDWNG
jgi:hypothetical protein